MKKITAIILLCILMTVGCGNSDSTGNKALDGELNLESNQSLVIAQVTAIYGNEITLALAEKVDNSTTNENKSKEGNQNTTDADVSTIANDTSSNQDTSSIASDTSSNQNASAKRSVTNSQDSTVTKGDTSNEDSTAKESSSDDKTDKKDQIQVTRYTLTGEEMTATIPVGTPVTTLLGTVTTFSRIAVDNTLQIVTETNKDGEEIIVAIYIVG